MTAPLLSLPLSIMILDDNTAFLKNLGLHFENKRPYLLLNHPRTALQILRKRNYFNSKLYKHFKTVNPTELDHDTKLPTFDFESFRQILHDTDRFSETGILIIDYAMPEMSGIDFCREISDLPIKKIMVTGNTGYDTAVKAFNESLIDAFILKESKNILEQIEQAIIKLEIQYFNDVSKLLFANPLNIFKNNPTIYQEIFNQFVQNNALVEYYRLDLYGSYVGLDIFGNLYWLVIQSETEANDLLDIAQSSDADETIITCLKNRSHMVFLFSEADKKLPTSSWENFLLPITHTFKYEDKSFSVSMVKDKSFGLKKEKIQSLQDYLTICGVHSNIDVIPSPT